MFDFDSLREISSTISKNKTRTFLTGLAVAWGIFMLIVLLAAGNGVRNGIESNFSQRAKNSVTLWPGWTSMPYKGMSINRRVKFDDRIYKLITEEIPEVEYVSAHLGHRASVSYGTEYGSWQLEGVSHHITFMNGINVKSGNGRFLNASDINNRKKVVVINEEMKKVLFKEEDPIGKYVVADNNIAFQVIGVWIDEDGNTNAPAYIPFSTAQTLYGSGYGFPRIDFTVNGLNTLEDNDKFVEKLRRKIGKLQHFDPTDRSALYVWNTAKDSIEANQLFDTIGLFIIIIGIASLMAGVVGVGNIMLITVKERTREIGIRKAIGAKPRSILRLIIMESIIITTIAGYVGIVIGVGLTETIAMVMDGAGGGGGQESVSVFKDPTVDLTTVIYATIFLIICGVVAGLIPALKATKISPIEAMRAE